MNDQIVTAWADDYARLELLQAETAADRDVYREIAYAALDQLHKTTMALTRTRTQLYRLTAQAREQQQRAA